jgi:LuxR family maltose regulon positive regulatory protein
MTDTAPRFRPAFPLVEAKLRMPAPRPGAIERTRLVALLASTQGPRLVAMIAPPGYGKTTLLAQWAAKEPRPVVWLTLDDLDNDPAVLLTYVAAALDRVEPVDGAIRSALAAPGQRILATAVPRLASEMHRREHGGLLVLDDAHRLVGRTSLDALTALLDHLPPQFRVAVAGRTEPDLPLAGFRSRGDLLDIGPEHLAFDEAETAALARGAGLVLDPGEVRALAAQTEGWPAAIYLASIAGAGDGAPDRPPWSVSGRDRYIASYLRSEFERDLDDTDVTLLTRTSVLETLTGPSAEAVSGLATAAVRLDALATRNLLIQGIPAPEPTYRCHNLLRDFLQAELRRREPGSAPDLHRRAATWYAATGDDDRAIAHALAGGHEDDAARHVTAVALQTFYGGQPATLDRWLQALRPPVFERHPPLAVISGWIHLLNGRPEAADNMADIAERATFEGDPGDGSSSFESQRAMLRAVMARNGPRDVLANAELSIARERPDSPWRANALWLLGAAHLLHGDLGAADGRLGEAVAAGHESGGTAMVAAATRASIAMGRGDWRAAEDHVRLSRQVLVSARFDEIVPSLIVYAVGARVAIHRGDHAHGREELVLAQLVRPLASHGVPWFSVHALLEVARAYLAISDPAGAQVVLREAERIIRRRPALGVLTGELLELRRRLAEATSTLAGSSALTNAELRLLPLLPTYLSFQEIADRLMVSRNTVKTHAMSIYGKLQASSRSEAVERAVELGLLEPFPGLEGPRHPSAV